MAGGGRGKGRSLVNEVGIGILSCLIDGAKPEGPHWGGSQWLLGVGRLRVRVLPPASTTEERIFIKFYIIESCIRLHCRGKERLYCLK